MFRVTADGNCLYRACSLAVTGNEDAHILLRALTSIELYCYADYYAAHPHAVSALAKEKSGNLMGATMAAKSSWNSSVELPRNRYLPLHCHISHKQPPSP